MRVSITGLRTLPEVEAGGDVASLIYQACEREDQPLDVETIVVVAQKIVSKAEGAVVDLRTIVPSAFAERWAAEWNRDSRLIELILRQSRRVVKMDRGVLIAETHHGLITANAGVDQSNVPGGDYATILPRDPDACAAAIREKLGCGAVIISDTFGRPWREGLVNVAIGVSGLAPLRDCRGEPDRCGRLLAGTVIAVADEIAAAAGLVMQKAEGVPVVLIRGLDFMREEGSARQLMRSPQQDLFR